VPPGQRGDGTIVAHAVYVWMVQNVEYDLISIYPGDVTGGNWQTTFGGWGRSFADWAYTAPEVLRERRAICIEHARLAAALLRALNIPARPAPLMAHPVTQWWAQRPDGTGFWANMDTSAGRSAYRNTGDLWAVLSRGLKAPGLLVPMDAPIHVDWQTDQPALWWEHTRVALLDTQRTPRGRVDLRAAVTGSITPNVPPQRRVLLAVLARLIDL
jgi:hypothetical protein